MLVLKPLHDKFGIKNLLFQLIKLFQEQELKAINELTENTKATLAGEEFHPDAFKNQFHSTYYQQIDVFCENGYTKEEMKVVNETKKFFIYLQICQFHVQPQEFLFITDTQKQLILNLKTGYP